MITRCTCEGVKHYKNYGGRGISVCEAWKNSFEAFLSDMGECPGEEYSLDRIDNDGDYCPENCRWATRSQQNSNKRNTVFVEWEGKKITIPELSKKLGISQRGIHNRISRGKPLTDELNSRKRP
jgi:hypothetical protein